MATALCSGGQLHHSHQILKKQSVFHENSLHNNRLPLRLTYKTQLFLFLWVLSPTLVLKTKHNNQMKNSRLILLKFSTLLQNTDPEYKYWTISPTTCSLLCASLASISYRLVDVQQRDGGRVVLYQPHLWWNGHHTGHSEVQQPTTGLLQNTTTH